MRVLRSQRESLEERRMQISGKDVQDPRGTSARPSLVSKMAVMGRSGWADHGEKQTCMKRFTT